MSYTVVNPGGPKPRPATVTISTYLLYLIAGLTLVILGLAVAAGIAVSDVVQEQAVGANSVNGSTIGIVITSVLYVLLAVGFAVLAVFVGKGNNPARIVTWTLGGIAILCCGCGLASSIFSSSIMDSLAAQSGSQDAIKAINDATPVWMTIATNVVSLAALLALVAMVILLALPASNDYFRKEQEVWIPPTYPGDGSGGYPPVPPGPTPPPPPGAGL